MVEQETIIGMETQPAVPQQPVIEQVQPVQQQVQQPVVDGFFKRNRILIVAGSILLLMVIGIIIFLIVKPLGTTDSPIVPQVKTTQGSQMTTPTQSNTPVVPCLIDEDCNGKKCVNHVCSL